MTDLEFHNICNLLDNKGYTEDEIIAFFEEVIEQIKQ
jgi:hypothetical protein